MGGAVGVGAGGRQSRHRPPLFGVESSAHNGSIEGTFIAIARVMAQHPGDWKWWPLWNAGMPFENSYLPLLHWMVAAFSLLTG